MGDYGNFHDVKSSETSEEISRELHLRSLVVPEWKKMDLRCQLAQRGTLLGCAGVGLKGGGGAGCIEPTFPVIMATVFRSSSMAAMSVLKQTSSACPRAPKKTAESSEVDLGQKVR